jgi:hypothetical protein
MQIEIQHMFHSNSPGGITQGTVQYLYRVFFWYEEMTYNENLSQTHLSAVSSLQR